MIPPRPIRRPLRGTVTVLLVGPLVACASYNERTGDALRAFESGRFERAEDRFGEALASKAPFLAGVERGMVSLAAGHWNRAVEYFTAAAQAVEAVEREALISPQNAGELLTGWVINENFSSYDGEGYERAMLHACLGLAYLARGEFQDTLVEVRLANRLLETEEKLYNTEYRAGGLGHVLSAIAYELAGDLSDAYIDYARMAEKDLAPEIVGPALVRLSRALGRSDALAQWTARYGEASQPADDAASVILIAGVGIGPYKKEKRLDIPTPDGVLSWSVPGFQARSQPIGRLELEARNLGARVRSVVVEDVGGVARKNLDDRIAWLAARSTVRTFLKRELRKNLADEHGAAGALLGDLFTILTERADLRTWTTLPDTWQVARLFVPPGTVDLAVSAPGGSTVTLGAYRLQPGETVFVLARTLGRTVHAHAIGGEPMETHPEDLPGAMELGPASVGQTIP